MASKLRMCITMGWIAAMGALVGPASAMGADPSNDQTAVAVYHTIDTMPLALSLACFGAAGWFANRGMQAARA